MQFQSVDLYESDREWLLTGRLRELEIKGKVQLGNLKSGRGLLWDRSLTRAFN